MLSERLLACPIRRPLWLHLVLRIVENTTEASSPVQTYAHVSILATKVELGRIRDVGKRVHFRY